MVNISPGVRTFRVSPTTAVAVAGLVITAIMISIVHKELELSAAQGYTVKLGWAPQRNKVCNELYTCRRIASEKIPGITIHCEAFGNQ